MQQPAASPAAVASEQAGCGRPQASAARLRLPPMPPPHCRQDGDIIVRLPCSGRRAGGGTNARAACLSLARTDRVDGSEQDVPYSLLLLTSRYGKSSLLRRGTVPDGWHISGWWEVATSTTDRCLDGGRQLAVMTCEKRPGRPRPWLRRRP
jgi:hypothetical protein